MLQEKIVSNGFGFSEVFMYSGVDAGPLGAAMIVPAGGSNVIALPDGAALVPHSRHFTVKKLALHEVRNLEANPKLLQGPSGITPTKRKELSAQILGGKWSFYLVTGTGAHAGLEATALIGGKTAKLKVDVVPQLQVKIAIRQIWTPDPTTRKFVPSGRKPCEPKFECAAMNDIWIPQTNIAFDLVPSPPFHFDPRNEVIRDVLVKTLQITKEEAAAVPKAFDPTGLGEILKTSRPDTTFTIYAANRVGPPHDDSKFGQTNPQYAFSIVSDSRHATTMAHEIGHFLVGEQQWGRAVHPPNEPSISVANKLLMNGNGAEGHKIPFIDAKTRFRPFILRGFRH
jgi:hypothetical protein